ncbi:MAG TPA: hypothetical protein ENH82_17565 [bacterium]|nr:hypothetical protein [bacterium]
MLISNHLFINYKAVGSSQFTPGNYFLANNLNVLPLYNGNISSTTTLMNGLDKIGFQYNYDQLNRLKTSTAINGLDTANNLWNVNLLSDYYTTLNYDANGNILEMLRRGTIQNNQLLEMDMLTYNYKPGTNQLTSVNDAVASNNYSVDIDDQQANNYVYTAIGELTKDESEGIASIEWDVYGKVKKLKRDASSPKPELEFRYDGMGNRVSKKVITTLDLPQTVYYVRDAQGNILATYRSEPMTHEFLQEKAGRVVMQVPALQATYHA